MLTCAFIQCARMFVNTELFQSLGVKVSKDKVKDMFAEVDEDGSGEIDFDEFLVLVAKQVSALRCRFMLP